MKTTPTLLRAMLDEPIKIVEFGWVASVGYSAGAKVIALASPTNASTGTAPSGYTFKAWLAMISVSWIGAPYAETPHYEATNIWTPTQKPSTSGVSIKGYALYVRNDLA